MNKMIITIKNGEITSEIKGVKGRSCQDIDKFLEEIGTKESTKHTLEYYQNKNINNNYINIVSRWNNYVYLFST